MNIYELCGIQIDNKSQLKLSAVIDWGLRLATLERALQLGNYSELTYSQICILEESDCDAFATIKLWLANGGVEVIDGGLRELSLPKDEIMVDTCLVCEKLKEFCHSPIETRDVLRGFSTLYGQYDYDDFSQFKLSPDACEQIISRAQGIVCNRASAMAQTSSANGIPATESAGAPQPGDENN